MTQVRTFRMRMDRCRHRCPLSDRSCVKSRIRLSLLNERRQVCARRLFPSKLVSFPSQRYRLSRGLFPLRHRQDGKVADGFSIAHRCTLGEELPCHPRVPIEAPIQWLALSLDQVSFVASGDSSEETEVRDEGRRG